MYRLPRKIKKKLKKRFFFRYGVKWLKCCDLIVEYNWFYKNIYIKDILYTSIKKDVSKNKESIIAVFKNNTCVDIIKKQI